MSRKLKSLQDIQVQARILQEENLDLQSQLKITQGELNKRLQEEEKKMTFQTEDVVCTNVHRYIHTAYCKTRNSGIPRFTIGPYIHIKIGKTVDIIALVF